MLLRACWSCLTTVCFPPLPPARFILCLLRTVLTQRWEKNESCVLVCMYSPTWSITSPPLSSFQQLVSDITNEIWKLMLKIVSLPCLAYLDNTSSPCVPHTPCCWVSVRILCVGLTRKLREMCKYLFHLLNLLAAVICTVSGCYYISNGLLLFKSSRSVVKLTPSNTAHWSDNTLYLLGANWLLSKAVFTHRAMQQVTDLYKQPSLWLEDIRYWPHINTVWLTWWQKQQGQPSLKYISIKL